MKSTFRISQIVISFILLVAACQPEPATDISPEPATDIPTAEEAAGCKQIVFTYVIQGFHGFESNIVSICPDGTDKRRLTSDAFGNSHASWSPDGSEIAFLSSQSGSRQLHLMDQDGGNSRQITFGPDTVDGDWFWLSDGNRIAVLRTTGDGERSWQTVNVGTNEIISLTDWSDDIFFQSPAFSHDGTRLAYLVNSELANGEAGAPQIHIRNIDSSNDQLLTDDNSEKYGLIWSPDDSQIAFLSELDYPNGEFILTMVNLDGSNFHRFTESAIRGGVHFTWSPDGESLAIFGNESLSILDLKSGAIIKLFTVESPNFIISLSWQP